jgi:hypothetical protein
MRTSLRRREKRCVAVLIAFGAAACSLTTDFEGLSTASRIATPDGDIADRSTNEDVGAQDAPVVTTDTSVLTGCAAFPTAMFCDDFKDSAFTRWNSKSGNVTLDTSVFSPASPPSSMFAKLTPPGSLDSNVETTRNLGALGRVVLDFDFRAPNIIVFANAADSEYCVVGTVEIGSTASFRMVIRKRGMLFDICDGTGCMARDVGPLIADTAWHHVHLEAASSGAWLGRLDSLEQSGTTGLIPKGNSGQAFVGLYCSPDTPLTEANFDDARIDWL